MIVLHFQRYERRCKAMGNGKVTDAQARATAKWESANYDRVLIRFPKGTKDRIQATGHTVNGFVKQAVLQALESIEKTKDE